MRTPDDDPPRTTADTDAGAPRVGITPAVTRALDRLSEQIEEIWADIDQPAEGYSTLVWRVPDDRMAGPYPMPRAAGVDAVAWHDVAAGRWRAEVVPAHRRIIEWHGQVVPAGLFEDADDATRARFQAQVAAVRNAARGEREDVVDQVLWLANAVAERGRALARTCESVAQANGAYLEGATTHGERISIRALTQQIGMPDRTIARMVAGRTLEGPGRVARLIDLVAMP